MKRFYKVVLLNVSFLTAVISFQNCSKVHPELLIDDKMAANGSVSPEVSSVPAINTDDIQPGTEVVVDQPQITPEVGAPASVLVTEPATPTSLPQQVIVNNPEGDECTNKGPGGGRKNRVNGEGDKKRASSLDGDDDDDDSKEDADDSDVVIDNQDSDQRISDNKSHELENEQENDLEVELENELESKENEHDRNICESQKGGDNKVVVLDESNKVFDGSARADSGKPTYIFSEVDDVEIRNTRGKTIVCNCKVKSIENNVGKLVLVNSVVDEVKNKRGNLTVVDSTAARVTNMKGVIKK